jgi:hypothetical protein
MVLWNTESEQYIKHTYSVISEDIKEDTFHAWAHFRAVLLKVEITKFSLIIFVDSGRFYIFPIHSLV